MKRARTIICLLTLLAAVACERMPLYDLEKQAIELVLKLNLKLDLQLKLDLDVDVDIETAIKAPEHMKVCFYSPEDGHLRYTEFVDSTGGVISTPAGTYEMLVYSFGTEYVQIRGEGDINTIEAFTSDITETKRATLAAFTRGEDGEQLEEPQGPIIYAPDHLLVARENVVVPEMSTESRNITLTATANTIVETYGFEVHSVIGAEYIESCEAFVTNQARSSFFGRGEVNPEPATIYFRVGVDRKKGCLYTTFNTFGKLPGESRSYLHILVRDTGGQEYHISADITEEFEKPDNQIVVEEPVEIPEPQPTGGGGIAPTVTPWDEEIHDVPIG